MTASEVPYEISASRGVYYFVHVHRLSRSIDSLILLNVRLLLHRKLSRFPIVENNAPFRSLAAGQRQLELAGLAFLD